MSTAARPALPSIEPLSGFLDLVRQTMKQLAAEIAEATQNMAACMKLVHGVEENAFGTAAEPWSKTQ